MAPAFELCGSLARVENGQWSLLTLIPDTSVPPFTPLMSFKLLPLLLELRVLVVGPWLLLASQWEGFTLCGSES